MPTRKQKRTYAFYLCTDKYMQTSDGHTYVISDWSSHICRIAVCVCKYNSVILFTHPHVFQTHLTYFQLRIVFSPHAGVMNS